MLVKSQALRLAGLLAGVVLLSACGPGGEPDIALAEAVADFGGVANGQVRQLTTEVLNQGQGPLIIEAVTTSCGCTTAAVEPMTIPAGGAGVLSVTYDSGAHGPEFVGPVRRQVFIASNDPDERELVFEIAGEVISPED